MRYSHDEISSTVRKPKCLVEGGGRSTSLKNPSREIIGSRVGQLGWSQIIEGPEREAEASGFDVGDNEAL